MKNKGHQFGGLFYSSTKATTGEGYLLRPLDLLQSRVATYSIYETRDHAAP